MSELLDTLSMYELYPSVYVGGCQNYCLVFGPSYNTAPSIEGTPKGTIILTTTHIHVVNVRICI